MANYHSCDLRKGRFSESGRPYLITTATAGRIPVFQDYDTGQLVIDEIRRLEVRQWVSSICWVVMPVHLHWLLVLRQRPLHRVIQNLKCRSALSINRHLNRSGKVWRPGFHDRAVRRDEDIKKIARYVIANPVRAGLVNNISDYPLWDALWVEDGANLAFLIRKLALAPTGLVEAFVLRVTCHFLKEHSAAVHHDGLAGDVTA